MKNSLQPFIPFLGFLFPSSNNSKTAKIVPSFFLIETVQIYNFSSFLDDSLLLELPLWIYFTDVGHSFNVMR